MFTPNKYTKWYFSICDKARNKSYVIFEKHHIIPRSFGGDNSHENLVALSPREHFLVHLLLVKMVSGTNLSKMRYALIMMSNPTKKQLSRTYKVNSHVYDFLKRTKAPRGPMSEEQKEKLSISVTGFKHTSEAKEAISKKHRRHQTEETSRKISESKKGISTRGTGWTTSSSTREKQKLSNLGKKRSDEARLNISKSQLGTKIVNNGHINKKIPKEELNSYLADGWIQGRLSSSKLSTKGSK